MSLKDFIIYGAGISGFCMLAYGAGCSLNDWLKDRREDMKMARAIRLGRMAHEEHSYTIEPLSEGETQDIQEFCVAAERATEEGWITDPDDYAGWVEAGVSWAHLHSCWKQKPQDELEAA